MMSQTIEIDEMVSLERGEIDRRIYSDPAIFELEMERIFARSWLFLCHESQIPEPGDFFQSVMGRDNVLVVRQKDRTVKAMLNTCAHRGNAVCRAEEGNAKSFLCTYHGWSYGIDGQLLGVPGFKTFYNGRSTSRNTGWHKWPKWQPTRDSSSVRTTFPHRPWNSFSALPGGSASI